MNDSDAKKNLKQAFQQKTHNVTDFESIFYTRIIFLN